jgi:elongation factor Tu
VSTSVLARQVGVPVILVYLNKVDVVDDPELVDLVELEVRELLTSTSFRATPRRWSAAARSRRCRGWRTSRGRRSIERLMEALDEFVPIPQRDVDKPFLMPIEDVFSISGRGRW